MEVLAYLKGEDSPEMEYEVQDTGADSIFQIVHPW